MKKRKTKEEVEEEIESGDKEEDIYTDEGAEVAEDDDSITDEEEGFMKGYNNAENRKKRLKREKDEESL